MQTVPAALRSQLEQISPEQISATRDEIEELQVKNGRRKGKWKGKRGESQKKKKKETTAQTENNLFRNREMRSKN